ncbi:thiamine pyrophosphate-binding protein [Pelagibacterium lacus]|uniref:Thiamine pyrophosphate-binding protein n=1 Tax=Pelagibacterium lacus TaxID=2282655 RepID=A0A369VZL2_9HYPH|nr:thiamine pyrophosphate-binding protein [Pelagibacterium lacus]RDE07854.1 hypothetical protein DVH29_14460 [Pelagibacterium lacus]
MTKPFPSEPLRYPVPQKGHAVYGSDLMVDLLAELGAEYVFINPGSSFRGLHDSLVNYHGNAGPEIVLVTHEMIAVAMAHGYWKATGKPAVCILHNLVGLMSGSMAIFNAFCDQAPILILGGSGPADPRQRRFIDWAHSANTQSDLVRPFVKWTDEPATLEASLDAILRARRITLTAPQGPAYLSLDAGHQEQEAGEIARPDAGLPRYQAPAPIHPDPEAIAKLADLMLASRKPLVIGGRFGLDAEITGPLVELIELTGAGYMDDRAIVCVPTGHPQNISGDRGFRSDADLVVCFDVQDLTAATGGYGSQRSGIMGAGAGVEGATIVDISLNDYFGNSWTRFGGPIPPLDLQITADSKLALQALLKALKARAGSADAEPIAERRAALKTRKEALDAKRRAVLEKRWDETPIALERVTHEVHAALTGKPWSLVVRNHRTWAEGYWQFGGAGEYLGGDGGGGVGYGPGAAAGAALGLKGSGRLPVAMLGDGDFMMTPGAVWSACHHGAPLLMILLNNTSWGNDELHQREIATHRGRSSQTAHIGQTTRDPEVDLLKVASGFGAATFGPVSDPAELAGILAQAIARVEAGEVAVVEVITALE